MGSQSIGNSFKLSGASLSRLAVIPLALMSLLLFSPPGKAFAVPAGYHLVFDENFNGDSIEDTRFTYHWTGYEGVHSTYDGVSVGGGNLTLTTYSTIEGGQTYNWGGCVGTNQLYAYQYGYTEARIMFSNDPGNCMAYWLESDAMFYNASNSPEYGAEIDIIEQRQTNSDNDQIPNIDKMTLHAGGYDEGLHSKGWEHAISNLEGTWHTFGLLWTSDGYDFYVDGDLKQSYHPDWLDDLINGELVSHGPEYFVLDSDPCEGWCGDAPANGYGSLETSSTKMIVDYCRNYQSSPLSWNLGSGGSGTWSSAGTNWNYTDGGAGMTWSDQSDAFFRGSGGTVTISGISPTLRSLNFESGNYTITGSSLTLATNIVNVADGLTATIDSVIAGPRGITLNGKGTLVIGGSNTFSGEVVANVGSTITIQHANALGGTGDGTEVRWGALHIQGGITTAAEPLALKGWGNSWGGALRNVSGNNNYTGPITLEGGSAIGSDAGQLTLSGGISGDANDLAFTGSGNILVNSAVSGSGPLAKYGTGTLTLSGNNTFTGGMSVENGTLNIQHANALGTTAGYTSVASGGTLAIQGGITTANEVLTLNGSGYGSGGALRNVSSNNTYAGLITLGSAARINSDSGTLTLSNAGTITGSGNALTVDGSGNTVVNSVIGTAAGTLTKDGSGSLYLTAANTYSGTTTISAGKLYVGNGGSTGILGSGNVVNNASLYFNRNNTMTVTNAISGSGSVTKSSTGTTILTGANTYSGTTTISAGTLQIGNGGTTGSLGTGNVVTYSTLAFNHSDNITVSNAISGYGSLVKLGNSLLTLTGNNSYGGSGYGGTTISQGTLQIGNGGTSGTLGNNGAVSIASGCILKFNRSDALSVPNAISGSGNVYKYGVGTTTLTGNNTYTGTTTISYGTLQIGNGGSYGTIGTGNITNNSVLKFNRSTALTVSSVISGSGSVIKTGAGTVTLSGSNTYTGITNVEGGALLLYGMNAHNTVLSYGGCDIEQGKLIFDNPYSVNTIISLIDASYNDGDWDSGKFLCSTADEDHGLGWINISGDISVAYTVYGDIDLDGDVDYGDWLTVYNNQNTSGVWADGDLNYDGLVNAADLAIVNDNYGMTQSFMRLEIDPVPEPSTLVLLAIAGITGAVAYVRRRRSRS